MQILKVKKMIMRKKIATTRRIGCMVDERWIGDGVGERKEEGGTCKGERGYI